MHWTTKIISSYNEWHVGEEVSVNLTLNGDDQLKQLLWLQFVLGARSTMYIVQYCTSCGGILPKSHFYSYNRMF
jgi:hypothetical protein